ncbi:Aldo keto reductase [Dendrothele bispora CBS 962.96]|uniref:Aldo keto reductase n=1 Tax=Dendrothele bispora (strain CBS 962.96) TaxID=1314807 RepID=A0A4S8MHL8_DENBC|nr:Aldo keto reductase [Dendrothele bispora CBS 962.96]
MSLPPRKIGNASVNPIGAFYGSVESDEERFKVLDAAYAKGCTHWDSSNVYGDSEVLIGKWFKRTGKRDEIFLTSKFGYTANGARGEPEYVREQCLKSLERFGVDYIDLYYQHRVDSKVPIEITVGTMAELVKEGKVKYLGLSECTAEDMRRAHAVHPISAIQVEFSPLVLDIEDGKLAILKTARELGITVVVYSPLARGLITGQYKSPDDFEPGDFRLLIPKFSKENFPKILDVVERLKAIGAKHNATPGQVTLAWILAQGNDFVIIPGTKKVKYVEENAGAANVKLSAEEIASIREVALEANKIPGDRYGEADMKAVLVSSPPLQK